MYIYKTQDVTRLTKQFKTVSRNWFNLTEYSACGMRHTVRFKAHQVILLH